jgi:exonuclease SbcC
LEFAGIGSFAERMEIDFEVLGGAGMFLVEGPTGSGKSTILDAIVFALYGAVAGAASDIGRLDSHVRPRDHEPYVELDFSCGEQVYRIRRTPRHERDKRRGAGTVRDDGGVALVRLWPEPEALSHKAKEVGDWVIATVGLTKQQFVSTIVLAQGEFAAFLDADTAARAQILEKVFGTQFYKQVEDQLATMRKAATARRDQAEAALREAVQRCLGVLGLQDAGDDAPAAIERATVELGEQREEAQVAHCAAQEKLRVAMERLTAAEALRQRQEQKRRLQTRLSALEGAASGIESLRQTVAAHDRAAPALPSIDAWRRAVVDAAAAEEAAQRAVAALDGERPDPGLLATIDDLLGQLRAPAGREAELPELRAAVAASGQQVEAARQRVAGLQDRHVALDEALGGLPVQDLAPLRADLVAAQQEVAALARQVAEWARVQAEEQVREAAQRRIDEAARALDAAQRDVLAARAAWTRQQAALWAADLVDGQPCAVCGATEHPAPARPGGESLDLPAAESAESRARQTWLEARVEGERIDGRLQEIRTRLTDDAPTCTRLLAERTTARDTLEQSLRQAEQRDKRREGLRAERDVVAGQLADATVIAERLAAQHTVATAALDDAERMVAQAASGQPSVAARIAELTSRRTVLGWAVEASARSAVAGQAMADAAALLDATLQRIGACDVEAVEAAVLDESEAVRMRTEVTEHDRACSEVQGALQELADVQVGEAPDVEGFRAHVQAAEALTSQCHERLVRLEHVLAEVAPLQAAVQTCAAQATRVREETAGVIRMAELATAARGEVTHRVRLSSFVLMRRFESVVEAANDRLDAISEGRYQLRVEAHGLDNRGQAGLDLRVEDQRTERLRSTGSLSGGERFYVSLALALGLADVVRSESGGVQLGTLFIDEGFGSLDADVLEEVMDMLEQVRAGEDRVIGLVSHVDLLKQRIDPRISVRRDTARPGVSTLTVSV